MLIENPYILLTVLLMIAGIAGSLIPSMPGPLVSMLGVGVYWWSTGFAQPGLLALVLLFGTGLTALVFDSLSGYLGSKVGGANSSTAYSAAIAGLLMFFVAGPLGVIIGVSGVVLVREYLRTGELRGSMRASGFTLVSVMASSLVQGILTFLMLIIFLLTLVI